MKGRNNETYRIQRIKEACVTHGQSNPPTHTYRCWQSMKTRCLNPNCDKWQYYGGKGIKVCERWLKFENFFSDMGEAPPGKSIERIAVDGDYEPGNCKWATQLEQVRNSVQNVVLEHLGEKLCVNEWAARLGINSTTIRMRLRMGFPISKILHRGRVPRGTGLLQ